MSEKVVVSEIMPSLHAFAAWINAGGDPSAVPHEAFAAGWQARDAEVAALRAVLRDARDIIREHVLGVKFYCATADPEVIVEALSGLLATEPPPAAAAAPRQAGDAEAVRPYGLLPDTGGCIPCLSKITSGLGPDPWKCANGHTVMRGRQYREAVGRGEGER